MAIRNGISPRRRKNDIKRGRTRNVISLPSPAEEGSIEQTTIYPTFDDFWREEIVSQDWFMECTFIGKQRMKFVAWKAVSEMMRTIALRMNMDQDTRIWDELDKEKNAYDAELQVMVKTANAVQ